MPDTTHLSHDVKALSGIAPANAEADLRSPTLHYTGSGSHARPGWYAPSSCSRGFLPGRLCPSRQILTQVALGTDVGGAIGHGQRAVSPGLGRRCPGCLLEPGGPHSVEPLAGVLRQGGFSTGE